MALTNAQWQNLMIVLNNLSGEIGEMLKQAAVKKEEPKGKVEFKLVDMVDDRGIGYGRIVKVSLYINGNLVHRFKMNNKDAQLIADHLRIEIEKEC